MLQLGVDNGLSASNPSGTGTDLKEFELDKKRSGFSFSSPILKEMYLTYHIASLMSSETHKLAQLI